MNLEAIKESLEEIIREQDRCIKRNLGLGDDTDDIGDYVDLRTRTIALSSLAQIAVTEKAEAAAERRYAGLMKTAEDEE